MGGFYLDCENVKNGDNVLCGPNICLFTAGHPCKVIREITDEDKQYYFKNFRFDE